MERREPIRPDGPAARHEAALREVALGYPESYEEFPWGERAIKVRKRVFLFMSCDEKGLRLSVKLPHSSGEALMLPFTEPTGYGLGKSGWVSADFGPGDEPPMWILRGWIEESYRAVAPKKLVATLAEEGGEQRPDEKGAAGKEPTRKEPSRKKTAKRKPAVRKTAKKASRATAARRSKQSAPRKKA